MGRSEVVQLDADVLLRALLAIGSHKASIGLVKHIEETLVEGQASAQHGAYHQALVHRAHIAVGQRRMHQLRSIVQRLADFVGHEASDTPQVLAEK